jgi:hypothetical protein
MSPTAPTREEVLERLLAALRQAERAEAVLAEQLATVQEARSEITHVLAALRSLPRAEVN